MNPVPSSLWFEIGAATDVGRVRSHNEDRFAVRPDVGAFVVADGMGGHDDGEVASTIIAAAVEGMAPAAGAADLLADLEGRIIGAHREILGYTQQNGKATVGATLAALLVHSGFYAALWCGDSRIYLLRGGVLAQLSRDHTEARDMVERGVLTEAEALVWPRRNVLTRAIGVGDEPELEMEQGPARAGDVFLLCSDGLTGHVTDVEILAILLRSPPGDATQSLIALALERGGTDNVTVIVVGCRERPTQPAGKALRRPADVWE